MECRAVNRVYRAMIIASYVTLNYLGTSPLQHDFVEYCDNSRIVPRYYHSLEHF